MIQSTDGVLLELSKTTLGIELGSTRIKAVLITLDSKVVASGSYEWENTFEDGLWTYRLDDAIKGVQLAFANLADNVKLQYGQRLTTVGAIGISGMMHGYLPLDENGNQLAPFLTWRNTNTGKAADELTELFQYNIPLRWSIAHLYNNVLLKSEHLCRLSYITTLAGYIHYLLSGNKVIGIGDASGMFPIDFSICNYDAHCLQQFNNLIADLNYDWDIEDVLPEVLVAGQNAGTLTASGAKLLDPTGTLQPGIPMAPPEGDAATGMVATHSVGIGSGNISAGTSVFAMVVLKQKLRKLYRDIDVVTTPTGNPVAMVHCNNGTSEIDAWVRLFEEIINLTGKSCDFSDLYTKLYLKSLEGDPRCDGILLYNLISGEHTLGLNEGRPLLTRRPDSNFNIANFMRSQIYATIAPLALGMQILANEDVQVQHLTGHGGLFKTPGVAQYYLSAATGSAVTVMSTAGEGGPYGMAVLAAYMLDSHDMTFTEYLDKLVFSKVESTTITATEEDKQAFATYLSQYKSVLPAVDVAIHHLK